MQVCHLNIELKNKKRKRNRFTEEDDKKLLNLIQKYPKNWNKISELMKRKKKACKDRYTQYLVPKHSSWHWTTEEKLQLIYLKAKLKLKWDSINKIFPSRGPKTIKNQWYYLKNKPQVQIIIDLMKNNEQLIFQKNNQKLLIKDQIDFPEIFDNFDIEFIINSLK